MIDLVRVLTNEIKIPLHEVVRMATKNPAETLGLTRKGRLEVEADADLVVLSPNLEVVATMIGGQVSHDARVIEWGGIPPL